MISPHQPHIDINCCSLYHHSQIKSVTDCIIIILLRLIRNIIDLKGDTTYTNTIYIISIQSVIKYPSLMFGTLLHFSSVHHSYRWGRTESFRMEGSPTLFELLWINELKSVTPSRIE